MNKVSQFFLFLFIAVSLIALGNSLVEARSGISSGTRFLALSGFFLLTVTLAIGPLAVIWPSRFAHLIEPRRAVGIASFFLVFFHSFVSFAYQFDWDLTIFLSNFPAQIGILALAIFLPLAITSADWATKRLGPVFWKNLQRLNYFAFLISLWHFVLKANGLSFSKPNLTEFFLLAFAFAAIGLQLAGFIVVIGRKNAAKMKEKAELQLKAERMKNESQSQGKEEKKEEPIRTGSEDSEKNSSA